ncbi:MAG TPA: lipid-binding SYLF domain-containing protein [Terriglobales bacterium]|jgi:lipid-binding SYLF domain-containing protein|nr:lipid-binding SYLF domain-containing protein [Terriglobales bacterium]
MRRAFPLFLLFVLAVWTVVPAWGASKDKDEETLKNAATVLQEVAPKISSDLLAKAQCILVLPNVKKGGFIVGGSGGRGALSCRSGEKFNGKWSTPAMYSIGGASVGLQVGGSSTDFVLLVMDDKGVNAILQDKTKVGADASATAGPSSAASTASNVGGADLVTYSRSSGLFAGVSLDGATLHQDVDANQRLYDKKISAKEIVRDGAVAPTEGGKQFLSVLDKSAPSHK